jgi:hypothetical protein
MIAGSAPKRSARARSARTRVSARQGLTAARTGEAEATAAPEDREKAAVAVAVKAGPAPVRVPRDEPAATIDPAPAERTTSAQTEGTGLVQTGKTAPVAGSGLRADGSRAVTGSANAEEREAAGGTSKAVRRAPDPQGKETPPGEEIPPIGHGPIVRPIPHCRTQ